MGDMLIMLGPNVFSSFCLVFLFLWMSYYCFETGAKAERYDTNLPMTVQGATHEVQAAVSVLHLTSA